MTFKWRPHSLCRDEIFLVDPSVWIDGGTPFVILLTRSSDIGYDTSAAMKNVCVGGHNSK